MALTLRKRLAEQIGDEIESGALQPGTQLDERSLGERFGISRTPAREILVELSAAGLVRFVPRHGAVVIAMTPQEIVAMVEVLVALEGEAASLATRRMDATERTSVGHRYEASTRDVASLSVEHYSAINTAFHESIYAGCRNPYLACEIKRLRSRLAPYLRNNFVAHARLRSSHTEHSAILAAIEAGDQKAAEQAMRLHLLNGGMLYADMLAKLPSQPSRSS
jgi:DNA-binding GntR family transcriptional regulator